MHGRCVANPNPRRPKSERRPKVGSSMPGLSNRSNGLSGAPPAATSRGSRSVFGGFGCSLTPICYTF
jgi:hypothetical protein